MITKTFDADFNFFLEMINKGKHFALSRFGDGEFLIMDNHELNILNRGAGEFSYNRSMVKQRELLIQSYELIDKDYYVGIPCPCCVGVEKNLKIKNETVQSEDNLTWANIFVNSNYKRTLSDLLPILKEKKIILIANENSNIDNFPFSINKLFKVKPNAWLHNLDLIDELKEEEDTIMLFCAGPFANIAVSKLHQLNKKNTYIDFGSVLDSFLGLPTTRGYLNGAATLNKICEW